MEKKVKFDLDDLLIEPSVLTNVRSRRDVNPFYENGSLPLFTAPMDTVVGKDNAYLFIKNKINVCLPRGEFSKHDCFTSYSLHDFIVTFLEEKRGGKFSILIDMANGHISSLIDTIKSAKDMYGHNMTLMVGNVAKPETYSILSNAGADYIRLGIGNGGGCLTTVQLGVGYPMGSLIKETYEESCKLKNPAKIVADGGMKKYSDIIKSLALGADYVMVGSLFNKALESAGDTYVKPMLESKPILDERYLATNDDINRFKEDKNSIELYKHFRGMSTKEVQKKWGNKVIKTAEGIVKMNKVEYTLNGWVNNFEDYLRSAMSYTNSFNLNKFIGKVNINLISENSYKRFNK